MFARERSRFVVAAPGVGALAPTFSPTNDWALTPEEALLHHAIPAKIVFQD